MAEAWAKRRYEKHFVSNLTDSDGEQQETQHPIEPALECEYISQEEAKTTLEKCTEIGRLLGGMMAEAENSVSHHPTKLAKNEPNTFFPLLRIQSPDI